MEKELLKKQAEFYKKMFIDGYVDRLTAQNMIQPYLNVINMDMQKIARGYGRYFEKITFEKYIKMLDKCD